VRLDGKNAIDQAAGNASRIPKNVAENETITELKANFI
jgi:hypothetical protein